MKTKLILLVGFLLATTLTFTFTASAAIPHLMNFQGKATDKSGVPLNGTYNLTFRVYDSSTGGSPKWSETQANISISNGIFQVQLGSVTPLNLPFDEPYWISLEINTDGEMSPRTTLASVPYAYRAESLASAPVIPFYKKGFDIEYVDFNSVKITPGVMDVAGNMFTTSTYSIPLQLTYPDNPVNRDWVHGQKTNNSYVYVYAYNNNGQIYFKFSDESPDLSDQLGNTIQKPLLYQRYPSTDGVYYRYLGKIYVNNIGNIVTTNSFTDGTPSGTIMAWPVSNPPDGWLICDGSAVSRSDYANLFGIIGVTYGTGDGSTTFNLPDLRARVILGVNTSGNLGTGSAARTGKAFASTGGEEAHTLTVAEMPAHTHSLGSGDYNYGVLWEQTSGGSSFQTLEGYNTYSGLTATNSTGGGGAHNNLQPYITLNYIIKI